MKIVSLVAAATLAFAPLTANAGGLANVIEEPMEVMDTMAAPGGNSYIVPLLMLALVAAVLGNSGDDTTSTTDS